jgi:hypothetical protein
MKFDGGSERQNKSSRDVEKEHDGINSDVHDSIVPLVQ